MRAAIYSRYSSEQQRSASIEDQIRLCRERIERDGWTLIETYADAAISGATPDRPGYTKLLKDAREGKLDVVVAEALDRLSRDQEHVAGLYKQLGFSGVKLVTLAEGEVNELHIGLKGTMNALALKDLGAKTHRGLRGRILATPITETRRVEPRSPGSPPHSSSRVRPPTPTPMPSRASCFRSNISQVSIKGLVDTIVSGAFPARG
jgi:predicted site-specific integrase-resolvase